MNFTRQKNSGKFLGKMNITTGKKSSIHLIGHTIGFCPQIQKLEPPCAAYQTAQL